MIRVKRLIDRFFFILFYESHDYSDREIRMQVLVYLSLIKSTYNIIFRSTLSSYKYIFI